MSTILQETGAEIATRALMAIEQLTDERLKRMKAEQDVKLLLQTLSEARVVLIGVMSLMDDLETAKVGVMIPGFYRTYARLGRFLALARKAA